MRSEWPWVSLYSGGARYAKALTLPKAPLSPNRVETKETAQPGCTEPRRKGALTQRLAKTSSCSRSNRQARLSTLASHPPLPPSLLHLSLIFSCFLSLPSVCLFYASNKVQITPCMQVRKHTDRPQMHTNTNALGRWLIVFSEAATFAGP